jgi:hypothetical protein
VLTRLGKRDADRPREWLEGQRDPLAEADVCPIDLGDPQPGVGKLVGEQAEAGDQSRPAPVAGRQLEDVHLEDVARRCSPHLDRAGHRVDMREVEAGHGVGAGVAVDLLVRGVAHVAQNLLAGGDREHRLDRVVPDMVVGVRAHLVNRPAGGTHEASSTAASSGA